MLEPKFLQSITKIIGVKIDPKIFYAKVVKEKILEKKIPDCECPDNNSKFSFCPDCGQKNNRVEILDASRYMFVKHPYIRGSDSSTAYNRFIMKKEINPIVTELAGFPIIRLGQTNDIHPETVFTDDYDNIFNEETYLCIYIHENFNRFNNYNKHDFHMDIEDINDNINKVKDIMKKYKQTLVEEVLKQLERQNISEDEVKIIICNDDKNYKFEIFTIINGHRGKHSKNRNYPY